MFDVLKTLSGLVKNKKASVAPMPVQQKAQPQVKTPKAPQISPLVEAKARELIVEAKDEAFKIRRDAEEEVRRKFVDIEHKEGALEDREKRVSDLEKVKQEYITKLESTAHLTRDEARAVIMDSMRDQLKQDLAREVRESADRAKEMPCATGRRIMLPNTRYPSSNCLMRK
ncbi:MAG: Rnase Y domain-containing protein [Candidatus Gottesmanbacteria bacterium]|nr:Rnase Y domain-containing protein [Candidatus Gottesmanbacteria bacterium]